jgi:hypothetical protein
VRESSQDLTTDGAMPTAARRRARSFFVGMATGVLLVAFACGAATMAHPETVPRLASLPAPPTRVFYGTCDGKPYGPHTVTWIRSGKFWESTQRDQAVFPCDD